MTLFSHGIDSIFCAAASSAGLIVPTGYLTISSPGGMLTSSSEPVTSRSILLSSPPSPPVSGTLALATKHPLPLGSTEEVQTYSLCRYEVQAIAKRKEETVVGIVVDVVGNVVVVAGNVVVVVGNVVVVVGIVVVVVGIVVVVIGKVVVVVGKVVVVVGNVVVVVGGNVDCRFLTEASPSTFVQLWKPQHVTKKALRLALSCKVLQAAAKNVELLARSQKESLTYNFDTVPSDEIPEDVHVKWSFTDDNDTTTTTEKSKNVEVVVTAILPEQNIVKNEEVSPKTNVAVDAKGTVITETPNESVKVDTLESEILNTASKISEPVKRQITEGLKSESKVEAPVTSAAGVPIASSNSGKPNNEAIAPAVESINAESKKETPKTQTTDHVKQSTIDEPKKETTAPKNKTLEFLVSTKVETLKNETSKTGNTEPAKETKSEGFKNETTVTHTETLNLEIGATTKVNETNNKSPKTTESVNQTKGEEAKNVSSALTTETIEPRIGLLSSVDLLKIGTVLPKNTAPVEQLKIDKNPKLITAQVGILNKASEIGKQEGLPAKPLIDITSLVKSAAKRDAESEITESPKDLKGVGNTNLTELKSTQENGATESKKGIVETAKTTAEDIKSGVQEAISDEAKKESSVPETKTIEPRIGSLPPVDLLKTATDLSKNTAPVKQLKIDEPTKLITAPVLNKASEIAAQEDGATESKKEIVEAAKTTAEDIKSGVQETISEEDKIESSVPKTETIEPRIGLLPSVDLLKTATDLSKNTAPVKQLKIDETPKLITAPVLNKVSEIAAQEDGATESKKGIVETAKTNAEDIKSGVQETKQTGKLEDGKEVENEKDEQVWDPCKILMFDKNVDLWDKSSQQPYPNYKHKQVWDPCKILMFDKNVDLWDKSSQQPYPNYKHITFIIFIIIFFIIPVTFIIVIINNSCYILWYNFSLVCSISIEHSAPYLISIFIISPTLWTELTGLTLIFAAANRGRMLRLSGVFTSFEIPGAAFSKTSRRSMYGPYFAAISRAINSGVLLLKQVVTMELDAVAKQPIGDAWISGIATGCCNTCSCKYAA
ncbi:hypothetical protein B566_EDAN015250 [Ephemera danica]|nr:hypothetical protein B566_EDAN015250 [Ephemera danica]